jgi:hypothetical protein
VRSHLGSDTDTFKLFSGISITHTLCTTLHSPAATSAALQHVMPNHEQ